MAGTPQLGGRSQRGGRAVLNKAFQQLNPSKLNTLLKKEAADKPQPTPMEVDVVQGPTTAARSTHHFNTPPPLAHKRWDPNQIYYTDGSRRGGEDGPQCGAGLHHPAMAISWTIDPSGLGHTDTINRAELTGILAALHHILTTKPPEAHVLSDSLSSLWQMYRLILLPATLAWHPHRYLLQDFATHLHTITTNTKLRVGKVKAHIGVQGNEAADKLAGFAAGNKSTDWTAPTHPDPYASLIWPHKKVNQEWAPLTSLKHTNVVPTHLTYRFPGVYQRAWGEVEQHLIKDTKGYIHKPGIPYKQRRTATKGWVGCLYNNKLAYRFGHSLDSLCPLCKTEDSVGHMLGECEHEDIKGLHILRHDDTVTRIAKACRHSNTPGIKRSLIMVDATSKDKLLTEGVPGRLAPWLLENLDDEIRAKLRPDIVVLAINDTHSLDGDNWKDVLKEYGRFIILEVGYGGDTFYERTHQRKTEQHTRLHALLTAEGWMVDKPYPLVFGHLGTMYQTTWDTLRKKLDIPATKLRRLFSKIQNEAARRAHQIVATRWIKVQAQQHGGQIGSRDNTPTELTGRAHHHQGGPRRARWGPQGGKVEKKVRRPQRAVLGDCTGGTSGRNTG